MNESIFEKFTAEKSLFYILILAVVIVVAIIVYLFIAFGTKSITVISPNGEESWEIGQKYEITWKAKKVDKVGIALFNKNGEVEWIAENINAGQGKYGFEIYKGHEFGYGFWVAVFEYPWREEGKVDYSNNAFAITYPELSGCDALSIESEWPFLPSDRPGIRRVFITDNTYSGNLDGLNGADLKCQQEADKLGYKGNWMAFLGGDADEEVALARLGNSERKTEGIFVEAKESAVLIRGATCHRLLGKNINEFLAKFSDNIVMNSEKIDKNFMEKMSELWLGRLDANTKKNCITTTSVNRSLPERYSFTSTCQNWTKSSQFSDGYPGASLASFPTCYTSTGVLTSAVSLGALGTGVTGAVSSAVISPNMGNYCNSNRRLLCIED